MDDPVRGELTRDAKPEDVCSYVEQLCGVSVRPIVPPPEPALAHGAVPSAEEVLALVGVLDRLRSGLLTALLDHCVLTHILFLKTSPRVALGSYNRGIIRLFPHGLRLHTPDPIFGELSIFGATVLHEISEASYRLYLDQDPHRLVGVRSLRTPTLRSLFEECYLWWLETGEPPGVTDESEAHVLAAIMTTAVSRPRRVRGVPFGPLLAALGFPL